MMFFQYVNNRAQVHPSGRDVSKSYQGGRHEKVYGPVSRISVPALLVALVAACAKPPPATTAPSKPAATATSPAPSTPAAPVKVTVLKVSSELAPNHSTPRSWTSSPRRQRQDGGRVKVEVYFGGSSIRTRRHRRGQHGRAGHGHQLPFHWRP